MKFHLPVRLFKAVLACLTSVPVTLSLFFSAYAAEESVLSFSEFNTAEVLLPASNAIQGDTEMLSLSDENLAILYGASEAVYEWKHEERVIFRDYEWISEGSANGGVLHIRDSEKLVMDYNGVVSFERNYVEVPRSDGGGDVDYEAKGGAIFAGNGSSVSISHNESVGFIENTVFSTIHSNTYGGAIYAGDNSTVTLDYNGTVYFRDNIAEALWASHAGGSIYGGKSSTISLCHNNTITFIDTEDEGYNGEGRVNYNVGCAIYVDQNSLIKINENAAVSFRDFRSANRGSALCASYGSTIDIQNNDFVQFSGNAANYGWSGYGAAILTEENCTVRLNGNDKLEFVGNTVKGHHSNTGYAYGGAVFAGSGTNIEIKNNNEVRFNENLSRGFSGSTTSGGAIGLGDGSSLLIDNNNLVEFKGNASSGSGGAIGASYYYYSCPTYTISNNKLVLFEENKSESGGGALYSYMSYRTFIKNNDSVLFVRNSCEANLEVYGGAISGRVILQGNKTVEFIGNSLVAKNTSATFGEAYGGALYSSADIDNNGVVNFRDNSATGVGPIEGGAIYIGSTFSISYNDSVSFTGNTVTTTGGHAKGGAISMGEEASLNIQGGHNSSVVFRNNAAIASVGYATGGAIYGGVDSEICLGANILFEKNWTSRSDEIKLVDIHTDGNLSITGSVELRGGSYVAGSVLLDGTCVLNGTYAADYLSEIKVGADTRQQIAASRTHNWEEITINSGDLHLTGDARLTTQSLTGGMYLDSSAVKAGYYSSGGSSLHFSGNNYVYFREYVLPTGTELIFDTLSDDTSVRWAGTFAPNELTITINDENISEGAYKLVTLAYGSSATWDNPNIQLKGIDSSKAFLVWNKGTLYLNYGNVAAVEESIRWENGAIQSEEAGIEISTPDEFFLPVGSRKILLKNDLVFDNKSWSYETLLARDVTVTSLNSQTAPVSISFVNASNGAINVTGESESLEFCGLKHVNFENNSNAIKGNCYSTITLSNNESVTFSGNTARYAGGAIYGGENSTIRLSGNGSVTFSGNTTDDYGGAIYGYLGSTIELSGNGSVTFSGNTAFSYGGAINGSHVTLSENGSVEFSGNSASYSVGGAISGGTITLSGNGSVTFSGNTADDADGGAIDGGTITLSDNDRVSFCGNFSYCGSGGAISGGKRVTLNNNGSVTFSGNTASVSSSFYSSVYGGAIDGGKSGTITLSGNGSVEFSGNTASASSSSDSSVYGGAIYGGKSGTITLSGNGSVEFSGNTVSAFSSSSAYGGAICGEDDSEITLSDNMSVMFSGNTASASSSSDSSVYGGAIYGGKSSAITLRENENVTFSGNTASTSSSSFAYGGAIYGGTSSTITLGGNDSVTFSENMAFSYGGAIYSTENVILSNNDSVIFRKNTANYYGGAVYIHETASLMLDGNVEISFIENSASLGGAIYGSSDSTITLNDNESVTFSGNTASSTDSNAFGGAIYGSIDSTITLNDNGSVTFSGNTASSTDRNAFGGAIYGSSDSTITLNDNGSVTFSGNTASFSGGAIDGGTITLSGNGSVEFSGNTASSSGYNARANGGAIYGAYGSTIELSGNESVTFSGNTASSTGRYASAYGGAIYGAAYSTITLSGNGSVTFSGNTASSTDRYAYAYGGAIGGYANSTIALSGNGSVEFSGNTASAFSGSYAYGGAIYGGDSSIITLSENDSVEFNGNTASSTDRYAYVYGGAIYGGSNSTIELNGNGSVTFSENSASSSSNAIGGAIYGYGSTITLSNNGSVTFSGNTAGKGGAICGYDGSTITLSGNESVTFSGNTASSSGGAIYGSTIELRGNGSVTFSGNRASYEGGAIRGYGNLNIRNNDSVLFEKNAEERNETYRLRCIYAGGSGDVISLSAAAGKSIEFRDSVYIDSGFTVELNADYTDAEGVVHKQTGYIIFTGKYTEQHLNELLASDGLSRTATESEILDSRTSVVSSVINLYGGCLRVEDGAVLDCAGLTAVEGTAATLRMKDAEVKGGTLTFNSGTALELEGVNKIQSLVNLNAGSDLRFVAGGESRVSGTGSLVLGGVLSVADGADVILDVATSAAGVTVGDDASLSLRGNFSLAPGAEDSVGSKLITVGRNAELSLTDSSLLGQVALADETSGLYYQYTNGAKLLQFSGDLGTGGLNLTTAADGYTVTVSGGTNFAGDITVLDGTVFDFRGNNTTLDATAKISLDSGSTLKLSGSDYAVMSDVLKRATGAGNARLESDAYLSHEDKIQLTGDLIVGSGGRLYLGELPNKVHGGDLYTDSGTAPVAPCTGTLVLDGGSLTFRGSRMVLGRMDVTANSSLEIWDQAGSNQKANEYCSIAELNVNASLQLATTWKSKLDIDVLQGSGAVTVGSSKEYREVRVHDLSGYTGVLSAAGDKTTLELNLRDNTTLNASAQISMGAGSTLKLSGSDYAVMSDVLKRATGAGNARLESAAYLSHEDKIQLTGDLIVGNGGHLYLGELPNKVHGGDTLTDSGTAPVAPCTGTLVLDGGSLTFRGSRMELGRVDVSANSSLEIWDQAGSNQKANEYCSIAELNVNAALHLATTWKSKLDIDVLQGSGAVSVGSSMEYHEVRVHDLSGYTGVLSAAGSKTMLELNLVSHSELNADSVQLSNGATATLSGSGTYHLATAKTLADGVSLAEDWSGVVRLSGATLVDDTLSGLSNANSAVELNGVSGYLSRADASTGAQTYDVNLKLTDNESAAAWNLNNGYNGDKRIFTGEITGTGTLERSSYRGTHQTLVFTGDTSGWTGAINHLPDSATSSGAPISTNVTFSGTQVLNVSTSTNGKGELNVTLDDEHLQAGSKVSVNGAIGANRLTVTEGTTVSLNNEVNVNTLRTAGTAELSADASVRLGGITLSADNPVSALISGVESTGSTMRGLRADAVVKNISIISTVSAYTVSSMTLQGVQFATETEQTALTLSGVVFDGTCSFSVGETGQILLDKAILTVLVGTPAGGGNGVLALDYSDLFHCTASGELEITMDKDVEQLLAAGYHTITLDLGDDVNYDNLNLTLNGATYAGNSQGGAQFSLRAVPEPTSATLSLLALVALAARRRRASL